MQDRRLLLELGLEPRFIPLNSSASVFLKGQELQYLEFGVVCVQIKNKPIFDLPVLLEGELVLGFRDEEVRKAQLGLKNHAH